MQAVTREDGTPALDPEEAVHVVAGHWGRVFGHKHVDIHHARRFLRTHGVPLPNIVWKLDFDAFANITKRTINSAPGPDGIPFHAWKAAGEEHVRVLYNIYCELLEGAPLPKDLNHAFLALIPKGDEEGDDVLVTRTPCNLRPLSLSNTDAKILASALK